MAKPAPSQVSHKQPKAAQAVPCTALALPFAPSPVSLTVQILPDGIPLTAYLYFLTGGCDRLLLNPSSCPLTQICISES